MNLRHIDPRSTDWMDAMLEGESGRKRKGTAEVEADPDRQGAKDAEGPQLMAGGKGAGTPESVGPPRAVSVTR